MIYTNQRVEGFVCYAWLNGERGTAQPDLARWYKEGKLQYTETVYDGIEKWPEAFKALFTGANNGKVVIRVKWDVK